MSTYYETEEDDIDIDQESREVDIYVADNECGSIYKTLTFDQIKEICQRIND